MVPASTRSKEEGMGLDTGNDRSPEAGAWMLVPGCWSLDDGTQMLEPSAAAAILLGKEEGWFVGCFFVAVIKHYD